jgi:hypothetical protein
MIINVEVAQMDRNYDRIVVDKCSRLRTGIFIRILARD